MKSDVRAVEDIMDCLLGQIFYRRLKIATIEFADGRNLPEHERIPVFAERRDAAVMDGFVAVGKNLLLIHEIHPAKTMASAAGSLRRIEGKS